MRKRWLGYINSGLYGMVAKVRLPSWPGWLGQGCEVGGPGSCGGRSADRPTTSSLTRPENVGPAGPVSGVVGPTGTGGRPRNGQAW